jgi:hypothetical protein
MSQISPYLVPGFYDRALAQGRHRQITGGWWEETGRIQLDLLLQAGLQPHHHLLDIGAGALRLGCKAVPYLDPGHYWATDASGALMRHGWQVELAEKDRLPLAQLIEDADFAFRGIPAEIDFAMCFAVFTHLPSDRLAMALPCLRSRFPALKHFLFTVFLEPRRDRPRGGDDAVTHPDRPPYHVAPEAVLALCQSAGFDARLHDTRLPRGQTLITATPV